MSGAPERERRLEVEVAHGGRPDAATLAAIEQAVLGVLSEPAADAAGDPPAWGRAARLEAHGLRRVSGRIGLPTDRRS